MNAINRFGLFRENSLTSARESWQYLKRVVYLGDDFYFIFGCFLPVFGYEFFKIYKNIAGSYKVWVLGFSCQVISFLHLKSPNKQQKLQDFVT